MKKCPLVVEGFWNKLEWHLSGYSFNFIVDESFDFSYEEWEIIFNDILSNLRDRKYEHLLVQFKNRGSLKFVQTITDGKVFRLEYGAIDEKGKSKLYLRDNLPSSVCIAAFCEFCAYNSIPLFDWKDITSLYVKE